MQKSDRWGDVFKYSCASVISHVLPLFRKRKQGTISGEKPGSAPYIFRNILDFSSPTFWQGFVVPEGKRNRRSYSRMSLWWTVAESAIKREQEKSVFLQWQILRWPPTQISIVFRHCLALFWCSGNIVTNFVILKQHPCLLETHNCVR